MQQNWGIQIYFNQLIQAWRAELSDKSFRWKLLVMPALFMIYSAITQKLGVYIEARKGVRLEDKMLSFFPSYDFSTLIFILLYTSLFALVLFNLHKPKTIMRLIEMHFMVAVTRQVCILLIALEPPSGIIVLRDVFLENTVYPHNAPLTKDLFFSGHVASIWIYFLCAKHKYLKAYMCIASLLMAFMVLSMRIHYTYDVYGALFFTTLLYYAPARVRPYYAKVKAQWLYTK